MSLSCFTSHGFFFSPLKRPPNHKHCNLTAEYKAMDQMFADKLSNLVHKSMLHGRIRLPFFLLWYIFFVGCLCFSSGFLVFRGLYWRYFLAFIFFALYSHNTKTTTWLDPRLAKKAKPPEKCEDGGMYTPLLSWFSEAYTHSIKYCTCFYTRAYLHCICPTLHEPSLLTLSHNESSNQPGWNMNVWLLFEMAHHLRVTLSIAVLKANFSKI